MSITFKIVAGQSGIVKDMNKIVEHERLNLVGLFIDTIVHVRLVETVKITVLQFSCIHSSYGITTTWPDQIIECLALTCLVHVHVFYFCVQSNQFLWQQLCLGVTFRWQRKCYHNTKATESLK